jgi:hypothetical protein
MASSPITTLAERARRARYPPTAVVISGDYPAAVAATMLPSVVCHDGYGVVARRRFGIVVPKA